VVRHDDVIKLVHVNTNTTLMTHDVACPLMATNTEFTTWPVNPAEPTSEEETHFILSIDGAHDGSQWMSKSSHFQLIHVITRVAMWTKIDPLPDWGLKQQEINGNKNLKDKTTFWVVDSILHDPSQCLSLAPAFFTLIPMNSHCNRRNGSCSTASRSERNWINELLRQIL
jgi:dolichyl-phosphate-mannose-protein mannosyltransferase